MPSSANDEDAEVMRIADPRVPKEIRDYAARFKTPVRYVVVVGEDIVLTAEDGTVVDICSLS